MSHSPSNTRVCESDEWCRVREKHAKLNLNIPYCMTVIKVLVILELIRPMTHQQGQDLHACYMEGIAVKISEQYKPPPRINLPISYAQRLTLNKQFLDNTPSYSFDIERRAKEQLETLKKFKDAVAENRKLRTERIQEKLKERKEAALKEKEMVEKKEVVEVSSPVFVSQESSRSCSDSNGILLPVQVKSCGILKPIPLNNSANQVVSNPADRSPFNISDFEADTSSPFDNMELKTLNDMEELAQVLRSETVVTTASNLPTFPTYSSLPTHSYYNSYLNTERSGITHQSNSFVPNYQPAVYNGTSDYYSRTETTPYSYNNVYTPSVLQNYPTSTHKTVPDILRALEAKLSIREGQCSYPKGGKSKPTPEDTDDPFSSLPKNLQDLTAKISTMGFPRGRVARACQVYGDDHKKVVEYLLALTELMDLGFSEKNVSSALQQCNNDRDKALDKLIL